MALAHSNITVGTTPQLIFTVPSGMPPTQVTIQNLDAAAIFIGDSTIAASGPTVGHRVNAGTDHTRLYYGGDQIWAVSAAGTTAGAVTLLYVTN